MQAIQSKLFIIIIINGDKTKRGCSIDKFIKVILASDFCKIFSETKMRLRVFSNKSLKLLKIFL